MRRITAGICLVAGVVSSGVPPALSEDAVQVESALIDQATLPDAIDSKGARPKADPSVISPAVDALPPPLLPLAAPPSLALPDAPSQVRIHELRPLTLEEALQLAEVNSPQLKAAASRVDQAKSALACSHCRLVSHRRPYRPADSLNISSFLFLSKPRFRHQQKTSPMVVSGGSMVSLQVSWDLINPARVPQIAAARDRFERAGDAYLIALRDLRLEVQTAYFALQQCR